jgi:hypothetical protein
MRGFSRVRIVPDVQGDIEATHSKAYRLGSWAGLSAMLMLAAVIFTTSSKLASVWGVIERLIYVSGALFVGVLCSYFVFLVFRRSAHAANIAFCAVMTLSMAGQVAGRLMGPISAVTGEDSVLRRLLEQAEVGREQIRRHVEPSTGITVRRAPKSSPAPTPGVVTTPAARAIAGAIEDRARRHEQDMTAFIKRGGLDARTMDSAAEISARVELAQSLRRSCEDGFRALQKIEDIVRPVLLAQGLAQGESERQIREHLASNDWTLQKDLWEQQHKFAQAAERQLRLLRDRFGQWRVGAEGNVTFTEGADTESYRKLAGSISSASQRTQELREKLGGGR